MSAASFSLTFTPSSKNLFLYPYGDTADIALTMVGDTGSNYKAIDEEKSLPDTNTYVYTTNTSVVSDRYILPDHSTESGTINNVQVYLRGKSNIYPASSDAVYKAIVDCNETQYYSDSFNLTTDYTTYSNLWTTRPYDSGDWTWADIDALQIGVMCSSPLTDGDGRTLILRPNAAGDMQRHYKLFGGSNYTYVDEETPDDENGGHGYVYYSSTGTIGDSYNIPDHTTETGTINSVSIFYRIARLAYSGTREFDVAPIINICSTGSHYGDYIRCELNNWQTHSYNWASQPSDSSAWTWDAIDSMQIGFVSKNSVTGAAGDRRAAITQIYAVVYYSEPVSPQIRTTQCYAKVNHIPSTSTYYLNKPISISRNHSRDVGMQNFWDGSREVYDINLTNDTITMSGVESGSEGDTRMDNILNILDYENPVTIDDLSSIYDGDWLIQDFSFRRQSSSPTVYSWNMILEKY